MRMTDDCWEPNPRYTVPGEEPPRTRWLVLGAAFALAVLWIFREPLLAYASIGFLIP